MRFGRAGPGNQTSNPFLKLNTAAIQSYKISSTVQILHHKVDQTIPYASSASPPDNSLTVEQSTKRAQVTLLAKLHEGLCIRDQSGGNIEGPTGCGD